MAKILRQGLRVSIKELQDLMSELMKEAMEFNKEIGLSEIKIDCNKKWQINIINKQPKCSDTWEIEK